VVERPAGRAAAVPGPALAEGATVAVVGAGLAGSACAAVFAARGWRVVLLDACERPRIGGGQPLLADHPHLAPDDNPLARLTRHALAAAWRWRGDRRPQGRLQLAHDATEAHRQARAVAALGPGAASFVRCVDADEASVLAGIRLDRGGLWLPLCGALDPLPLARFWTERPGVSRRFGRRVAALARHDEGWRMLAPDGSELARADAVVLATADAVAGIARLRHLPLQRLRGQSTRIRAASLTDLRCIVAGRGYVCPIGDGDVLVGASTDTREAGLPEPDDDLANLARLRGLVAALPDRETGLQMLGGSVGTRVTAPDRLPVIGELADEAAVRADAARHLRNDRLPLPRLPRLHALCGLGARGLLWAPLGAELIADRLAGTPPALERDLLAAIDPARFLRHALRQGQPV
jgi:tRNA 5-methylaminomethyl-2-thiouridine biosynthesis bifunctional protein